MLYSASGGSEKMFTKPRGAGVFRFGRDVCDGDDFASYLQASFALFVCGDDRDVGHGGCVWRNQ